MLESLVREIVRREGAKTLASLARQFQDLELAEEALQEAYLKALERWPIDGVPERPGAWLTTVAKRKGIDRIRRRKDTTSDETLSELPAEDDDDGVPAELPEVEDDRLRLLFTCCHPSLAPTSQVALALRTLCGLTVPEIARAFLEPAVTTAQRLVRAKSKIREARIPFELPAKELFGERLAAVLSTLYLTFNEGYSASEHQTLARVELTTEAIRLAELLVELLPNEAEPRGLHALMLFHDARRETRVDGSGALVPLEEQDRSRWVGDSIRLATEQLERAIALRAIGPYQLQAAIAALHARAPTSAETDWAQISALYGKLLQTWPTPIVQLNAAVALAMATTPANGLEWVETIEAGGELGEHHLLHAAKADLLRRMGDGRAAQEYRLALALTKNAAERKYLERRLAESMRA